MPIQWIDNDTALEQFLRPLVQNGGLLALDTEFLRQDSYYPRLCLVQLAREDGQVALVDPLRCSLTPLRDCWRSPAVTVILHAGTQDLEILYQATGTLPARLFDTQIAALLHGLGERTGLASLLAHFFNIHLPKDATRTPWCQRPLTERQTAYAANDVRHLIPLYHRLHDPLSDMARAALAEDFADQCQPENHANDPEQAWQRISGQHRLNAKHHTLLRQLAAWREKQAQQENRPRGWIISDDTLLAMARRPPASLERLRSVPGLTRPQFEQYGETLLALLDRTFAAAKWKRPDRPSRPTPAEQLWLLLARAVVTQQAHAFGFSHSLIPDPQLLTWLREEAGPLRRGWRRLLVGDPLYRLTRQHHPLYWQAGDNRLEIPHDPIFRT